MKKIRQQSIIGEKGVNLVQRVALEMGCLWHPTGGVEAGIDGWIEFRDTQTEEMLGVFVFVQSKATEGAFQAETMDTLEYRCDEADLEYWLSSTAPIILVRSRPATNEAYWVPIQEYFRDPARRRSRRITFDKRRDRFDSNAKGALFAMSVGPAGGIALAPPPKSETLLSNLLKVEEYPKSIYVAETLFRSARELSQHLRAAGRPEVVEWVLRSGRLLSIGDLREDPWVSLCDQGTVDEIAASEWAMSDDLDRQKEFVQVLNQCLRAMLRRHDVLFWHRQERYYFASTGSKPRRLRHRATRRSSVRTVVQVYQSLRDTSRVSFYRHNALEAQFRRFADNWYLQITPTYHFTRDGREPAPFYESLLKGIKVLERNPAVRGQVLLWASLLSTGGPELFEHIYPHLRFGRLADFRTELGIEDQVWLSREEDSANAEAKVEIPVLPLFSDTEEIE